MILPLGKHLSDVFIVTIGGLHRPKLFSLRDPRQSKEVYGEDFHQLIVSSALCYIMYEMAFG
jgi:hypothetical protein